MLAKACLSNGDDLVRDAQLLFAHERHARALALAVLAMEEYGKAMRAVAVISQAGAPEGVREYEDAVTSHRLKLIASRAWVEIFDSSSTYGPHYAEALEGRVRTINGLKFAALYVDQDGGGLRRPADVTPTQAGELLAAAQRLGTHLSGIRAPEFNDEVAHMLWQQGPAILDQAAMILGRAESLGDALELLRNALPVLGVPASAAAGRQEGE